MKHLLARTCAVLAAGWLASCGGTSTFDTSPLIFSGAGSTPSEGGNDDASSPNVAPPITSAKQLEGEYLFDAVDCSTELSASGTAVDVERLNEIRSQGPQIDLIITLKDTPANNTQQISILNLFTTSQYSEMVSMTGNGTFSTLTIINKRCGVEFVSGGAIAKCKYAEVPAICEWFLKKT